MKSNGFFCLLIGGILSVSSCFAECESEKKDVSCEESPKPENGRHGAPGYFEDGERGQDGKHGGHGGNGGTSVYGKGGDGGNGGNA